MLRLFLFLFASFTFAIELGQRFDTKCKDVGCKDFSLSKAQSEPTLFKRQLSIQPMTQELFAKSTDGNVTFQVTCNLNDTTLARCQDLVSTLPLVADHITSAIKVQLPIKVSLIFQDFCKDQVTDSQNVVSAGNCKDVLGFGQPAAFWTLRGPKDFPDNLLYPQSLAKQLTLTNQAQYGEYDIQMQFNSGPYFSWHFSGADKLDNIETKQYDFEFVALHEVMHGLGFVTLWQQANDDSEVIIPKGGGANVGIFDFNVQTSGNIGQWFPFANVINDWYSKSSSQTASEGYRAASSLFRAASTPGSTTYGFLSNNRNKAQSPTFKLYTPSKFQRGGSICHADQDSYRNTADFLMTPKVPAGRSLQIQSRFYESPVGPLTLKTLQSFGYTLTERSELSVLSFGSGSMSLQPSAFAYFFATVAALIFV